MKKLNSKQKEQLKLDIEDQIGIRSYVKVVYCQNCKYYQYETFPFIAMNQPHSPNLCNHRNNLEQKRNALRKYEVYKSFADIINANNTCPNYSRKWYKFWVK